MAALPTNPATHEYLFTDDMRFLQKAVIVHPTDCNRFLIIKRHKADYTRPDTWDLPGGCVLYGESHNTGLRREIIEETGLEVSNLKPIYVNTKYETNNSMYLLLIAFKGQAHSDATVLSKEHTDFRWVTSEQFFDLDPNYQYVADRELNINKTDFLRDIVCLSF